MLAIMLPAGLLSPVVDIASFLLELNVLDCRAGSIGVNLSSVSWKDRSAKNA